MHQVQYVPFSPPLYSSKQSMIHLQLHWTPVPHNHSWRQKHKRKQISLEHNSGKAQQIALGKVIQRSCETPVDPAVISRCHVTVPVWWQSYLRLSGCPGVWSLSDWIAVSLLWHFAADSYGPDEHTRGRQTADLMLEKCWVTLTGLTLCACSIINDHWATHVLRLSLSVSSTTWYNTAK